MNALKQDFKRLHTDLAEALVACRANATKQAVHALRTGTRKLEALLRKAREDHGGARQFHKTVKQAARRLKRVRKAAGPVRDLDVHRELAEELHGQALSAAHSDARDPLRKEYKKLDGDLRRRRKQAAGKLEEVLRKQEVAVESALQAVAGSLAQLTAAAPPALKTASQWTEASSLAVLDPGADSFEEELHGYRKRTKAARYIASMQPSSAPARELAQRLKKVQDSIGRWHDLMLLTREATGLLGKSSVLASVVRSQRDEALQAATRSVARGAGTRRPRAAPNSSDSA